MTKKYLGDGCYVEDDGHALVLTTENGIETTNRIVLEPEVYAALARFVYVQGDAGVQVRADASMPKDEVRVEHEGAVVGVFKITP